MLLSGCVRIASGWTQRRPKFSGQQSSTFTATVIVPCWCRPLVAPTVVRNLSIFIDADVSMRSHVMRTVSSCFAILRQPCCIWRSVPRTILQSRMSLLDLSQRDCGNATLSGISDHAPSSTSSFVDERRCQNDLFDVAFNSHLTVPASAALVESSWTNCV